MNDKYYVFMRRDYNKELKPLPDITKTPAEHMNYDGKKEWRDSGYLSLFRYDEKDYHTHGYSENLKDYGKISNNAARGVQDVSGSFTHYILIPMNKVAEVTLEGGNNDRDCENLPKTHVLCMPEGHKNRNPVIYSTTACNTPIKANQHQYIYEHLFSGDYPQGTKHLSEDCWGDDSILEDLQLVAPPKSLPTSALLIKKILAHPLTETVSPVIENNSEIDIQANRFGNNFLPSLRNTNKYVQSQGYASKGTIHVNHKRRLEDTVEFYSPKKKTKTNKKPIKFR